MIPTLPERFINEMSQRQHRFHHYLWHRVRNSWSRLDESEREAIHGINPAWMPPRPALDARRRPIRDNDSGEDFLFMHRHMLALANAILAGVNSSDYPCVQGWQRVPPPGDPDNPVPHFPDSGLEDVKSDEYFERFIAPWERQYTNPNYLRGVTLGQLGSDIEFTIYNDLHMRWAAPSTVGYRPTTVITLSIDRQWDAPAYDYLGETYSSHVNPIFWKLHGWLDDRIEDWRRARGIAGAIDWKGKWLGDWNHYHSSFYETMPDTARAEQDGRALNNLRLIDQIISESGASEFDGFFRPRQRIR